MKNRVRFFFLFLGLLGALAVHAQINELPRSTPEAEGVPSKAVDVYKRQGAGFIAGVDNGSPISMEKFKDNHRKAFYGKCLVVLQNNGEPGGVKAVSYTHLTYVTAEEVSKNSARLKIRTSLQYDVETQTEDSVQQADGTYVRCV